MRRIAFAAALAIALAGSAAAAGPYDDLLKRTSANTNSLVLVDVKGAFNSPLAKAEKWAEKSKTGSHGRLGFVPPDAEARRHRRRGEPHDARPRLPDRAGQGAQRPEHARTGDPRGWHRRRDRRAGSRCSRRATSTSPPSPARNSSAVYPADRQYIARYLRAAMKRKTPPLSPYLKGRREGRRQHHHHRPRSRGRGGPHDPADVAAVEPRGDERQDRGRQPARHASLASVKGMTVAIKITDTINGEPHGRVRQRPDRSSANTARPVPRTDRGPGHRDPRLRDVAADVHRDHDDADRASSPRPTSSESFRSSRSPPPRASATRR